MMSNHHAPYDLGLTRTTMAANRGKQYREVEQNPKSGPSSDCRLQPACMKLELLVIADQHAAVMITSFCLQISIGQKQIIVSTGLIIHNMRAKYHP